jgi:UDP-hydrolysing UDP-N-acetyl-D-glucosamine 2-epimerase
MNIPLAHTMGGEVSGTIDESIRHAVTKFAHLHFPASAEAAERIIKMGERPEDVHVVGCPRLDLVAEIMRNGTGQLSEELFETGVGERFDLTHPFVIVSQHPVTTEYGAGEQQIAATLIAVKRVGLPAIALWPNADAGAEQIARGIRKFREDCNGLPFHFFKNIPVETYIKLMLKAKAMVGNSSAAIREGALIGIPAVNIGTRQQGRQRGSNVLDVGYDDAAITKAIERQVQHGRYPSEPIYGNGCAGEHIARVLATHIVNLQKRITY